MIAVLLLLQANAPTVGDTVWVGRTLGVPAGHAVRAADWEISDPMELLGRPTVTVSGDSARISYPVVFWRPGQHQVEVPGPLLLGPEGTVDSMPSERVRVTIQSVLPSVPPDSMLSPQPPAGLVSRHIQRLAPLAMLLVAAMVLLLPLHFWWRRRGKPSRPRPIAVSAESLEPPLARWADAGEYRAVASVSAIRLRAAVAERVAAAHAGLDTERVLAALAAAHPEWPLDEIGDLLRALDDARFGSRPAADVLELSHSTLELRERLRRAAA
jgi:hypothetical protein